MGTHMPYWLTQCYLPFAQGDIQVIEFLPARYLFVLLYFCRSLLCLKIAYACCLRMMCVGSYIIFFIQFIQTARQLRNAGFAKFFDKS